MKAITIHQPWATLIALGAKQYETRHWPTKYRGPLAIHASKHWNTKLLLMCYREPFFRVLHGAGIRFPSHLSGRSGGSVLNRLGLPFGAVVAVAELAECLPTYREHRSVDSSRYRPNPWVTRLSEQERAFGDFGPDRWGWPLTNVVRLPEPIEAKGLQGLWDVPEDLAAMIMPHSD